MKSNPKRKYLISVYLLPVVIAIVVMIAIWYASAKYKINTADVVFGYFGVVITAFVLSFVNKIKWLPLPDGSYVHKSDIEEPPRTVTIEPDGYPHLFYTSASSKISSITLGLFLVGGGLYIFGDGFFFLPLLTITGGVILVYSGYKELLDKEAKLKLAKEGLWMKKFGYKPWSAISHIELKVEKNSRYSQTYLEIYLKDSFSDYPDQKLPIGDLKNKGSIQPLIKALFRS